MCLQVSLVSSSNQIFLVTYLRKWFWDDHGENNRIYRWCKTTYYHVSHNYLYLIVNSTYTHDNNDIIVPIYCIAHINMLSTVLFVCSLYYTHHNNIIYYILTWVVVIPFHITYLLLLLLLQLYVRELAFLGRNRFLLFVSYYLLILLLYIFFFISPPRQPCVWIRDHNNITVIDYYYNYYYDCRYRCCCREDEETTMRVARGPAYAIWLQREGKGSFDGRERRADPRIVAPGKRTDTPQAAVIVRCPLALSVPFW